jgi:hypothetical protein
VPETEPGPEGCVCARCDREIEECSFCGERECFAPMCYRDLLSAFHLHMAQPHAHAARSGAGGRKGTGRARATFPPEGPRVDPGRQSPDPTEPPAGG